MRLARGLFLVGGMGLSSLASAADVTVCGSTCNYSSLAAAVAGANSGDRILISAGTYAGTGAAIGKNFTIIGAGAGSTTISAPGYVVRVDGAFTVTMSGVTLTSSGNSDEPILEVANSATFNGSNLVFSPNTNTNSPTAVVGRGNAKVNLTGATLTGQVVTAANTSGGVMRFVDTGTVANLVSVNVTGSNQQSTDGNVVGGAAVMAFTNSQVNITGGTFSSNTTTRNGGAVAYYNASGTISGTTFSSNTAGLYGGAIYSESSNVTVTSARFTGNTATAGYGGGVYAIAGTGAQVSDSVFATNSAWYGGGVFLTGTTYANVTRNTFCGNTTPNDGGGVYVQNSIGSASTGIRNNFFVENTAAQYIGGAVVQDADVPVTNNTFVQNSSATTPSLYVTSGVPAQNNQFTYSTTYYAVYRPSGTGTLQYNNFYANAGGNYSIAGANTAVDSTNLTVDPKYLSYVAGQCATNPTGNDFRERWGTTTIHGGNPNVAFNNPTASPKFQGNDIGAYGGPAALPAAWADADGDTWPWVYDCNDANAAIHPEVVESCNGVDDNCDGVADEGVVPPTWYRDADNDTYGALATTTQACSAPAGYVANSTDCNDTLASVRPGAPEVCNSIDDNCVNGIDEGVKNTYYADSDSDAYGNNASSLLACVPPTNYVSNNTDCNDSKNTVYPGAPELCDTLDNDCDSQVDEGIGVSWYADTDRDTYGNAAVTQLACAQPNGFVNNNTDCNDGAVAIHPGATEVCNAIDDDCDTLIDENVKNTYYQDTDGDNYGNTTVTSQACSAPGGYVSASGDCLDTNRAVFPGNPELCDALDNDCNTSVDDINPAGTLGNRYYRDADVDTFGNPVVTVNTCASTPPGGYVTNNKDCNDASATTLDGINFYRDSDRDTFGDPNTKSYVCVQPSGYVTNLSDCDDTRALVNPNGLEICNLLDDNCNGQIDTDATDKKEWWADGDNDTYGNKDATSSQFACLAPAGTANNKLDCDDRFATIRPGAPEQCNEVDDNCNGLVDDNVVQITAWPDTDGDGYGDERSEPTQDCEVPLGYIDNATDCDDTVEAVNPAAIEICNGVDDNCDDITDVDAEGQTVYYVDVDGDGFGEDLTAITSCESPGDDYILDGGDCDDADENIHPGVLEYCDAVDNDCNGFAEDNASELRFDDLDEDGYGDPATGEDRCAAPEVGESTNGDDCDDTDPLISPEADEIWYNDVDDACDGGDDNDQDSDGFARTESGGDDCNDVDPEISPDATDVPNDAIDQNCDGVDAQTAENNRADDLPLDTGEVAAALPEGCACDHRAGSSGALGLLALGWLVGRRRQR